MQDSTVNAVLYVASLADFLIVADFRGGRGFLLGFLASLPSTLFQGAPGQTLSGALRSFQVQGQPGPWAAVPERAAHHVPSLSFSFSTSAT